MAVFPSERCETEAAFANLAIAKSFTLAAAAPDAGNENLAVADRFRIAKAKSSASLKVRAQDLRTLGRPLCWNDEKKDAAGNEPSKCVIQEHCLKSFLRVR